MSVTKAGNIVFVATESRFGGFLMFALVAGEHETLGAKVVSYYGPDKFIRGH